MSPRHALQDAPDGVLADAVLPCETLERMGGCLGSLSRTVRRSNLPYLGAGEFMIPVGFPQSRFAVRDATGIKPSLSYRIMDVVEIGACEEVGGTDANRVVAAMADYLRGFEWAVSTLVDVPMRGYTFMVSPEPSVPLAKSAGPTPTAFYVCFVHEQPKPLERVGQLAGLAYVNSGRHDDQYTNVK